MAEEGPLDALLAAAAAAERRREADEAERLYRQALRHAPADAGALHRLGLRLRSAGRREVAIECLRRAAGAAPGDASVHNNHAGLLREAGRLRDAVAAYRAALAADPGHGAGAHNLAETLLALGDRPGAEATYRTRLGVAPGDVEAWNGLARVRLDAGDLVCAEQALRAALERFPRDATTIANLGVVLEQRGAIEAAEDCFSRAVEADPGCARAWENLVRSRRFDTAPDEVVASLEAIAEGGSADPEDRLLAHFALGKVLDDAGAHDAAFAHYATGNRLKRAASHFDARAHREWVDRVIAVFDERFFRERSSWGEPSELPVFVVGMIRSGTTLVEQILASHPAVHGAGELLLVPECAAALARRGEHWAAGAAALRREDVSRLAGEILTRLRALGSGTDRVVDKLPTNFLFLGLVALLFPGARVVHCRRDPRDVSVSIYFQRFASGHDYAYDLGDIAAYHREYERLMAHWRAVAPLRLHEIEYERLVGDPGTQARRLVEACGLAWDERCMSFHEHARAVRTASSRQVREPVHARSVGRWRAYRRHLEPLLEALGPVVPR